jgi:hypothetical protein
MRTTAMALIGCMAVFSAHATEMTSASSTSRPALITDLTVRDSDSKLVRAAKMAVAARTGAVQGGWAIDDRFVSHVPHALGVGYGAAPAYSSGQQTQLPVPSTGPTPAQVQKQVQALRQEQGRMAEEMEQPYGGEVSEDRAQQRMEQIPGEIKGLQRSLPSAPPPQQPSSSPPH